MAHLLGLMRLGSRYISCFFGDNCPVPRPNPLYTRLVEEGAALEHWSVDTYVAALRAGALGHPYAVTCSLRGTTLGEEMVAAGRFAEVDDPLHPGERVGLVSAMRADVAFVHALAADAHGRALFSAPYCEGFWGCLGARRGIIVTCERLLHPEEARRFPEALELPPERVLAVSVEPFGAHPQPLFATPSFGAQGYRDDDDHYVLWREMASAGGQLEEFRKGVLEAPEGGGAYRNFVGTRRLDALRGPIDRPSGVEAPAVSGADEIADAERTIILAARQITRRVRSEAYPRVIAGVGQAFFASRLAKLQLQREGIPLEVMVETGLHDVECGPEADGFLLAHSNLARSGRLSRVENALSTLACGADNRCLGVIGAGQVDVEGNINSTRLRDGRILVGSGGASDIAAGAAEVVVLSSFARGRLVPRVDYVTSPGRAVRAVATEAAIFARSAEGEPWTLSDVQPGVQGLESCPWPVAAPPGPDAAVTVEELALLRSLDPKGRHTRRA
jgi:acyl CoA:acetate/3-ketoacid CoA transferase alpha subunit